MDIECCTKNVALKTENETQNREQWRHVFFRQLFSYMLQHVLLNLKVRIQYHILKLCEKEVHIVGINLLHALSV